MQIVRSEKFTELIIIQAKCFKTNMGWLALCDKELASVSLNFSCVL